MGLFSDGSKGESPAIREIVEAARKRLKENPADAGAVLKLADALAGSGRKDEAVRLLNRYGPIVQSRGRLEEAIAIYKKAAQLDPDCSLTSSTYLSHLQLKKIVDAEKESLAVAPPPAVPPPSGSFSRPGPDPVPPASGSFVLPKAASGPPPSGSFERPPATAAPPPIGSFPLPDQAPPAPSAWSQKKESVHGARAGIPLLRDIPPLLIDLVLQKINLVTLAAGEELFREGAEGNSVFFVVQGALDVTAFNDAGARVLLRTARDGEVIGEASFLTGLPRYSTVTAREPSNLLELDHNALAPIARKQRALADALNHLYAERVLTTALARSRVFGVLPDAERRELARALRTVSVPAGTAVVRQGVLARGAYVVKRGAFRVTFHSGDREVAVALLRPHELFGDLAETAGQAQAETVTSVMESELLCLDTAELAALRARSPQLSAALEALRLDHAERCVAALRAARR
ncbi:MAG: cyclic nucleotide-binding domain-containing protein [Thermoanaerobaculia bacterium]